MSNFQVIYPLVNTERPKLDAIMPTKWKLRETDDVHQFIIFNEQDNIDVGCLIVEHKAARINVDENTEYGLIFWQDFTMVHGWLAPGNIRFGIVYLSEDKDDLFEFDDDPFVVPAIDRFNNEELSDEEMEHLSRYANKTAYWVKFRFGDWHNQTNIKVQGHRRILEGGHLGEELGPREFTLGDLEE